MVTPTRAPAVPAPAAGFFSAVFSLEPQAADAQARTTADAAATMRVYRMHNSSMVQSGAGRGTPRGMTSTVGSRAMFVFGAGG
jgi:hypothetical protein